MFGQMRSRSRSVKLPPCPCGGSCRCHTPPPKEKLFPLVIPIGVPLIFPGMFILLACLLVYSSKNDERHIEVDGQDCIINHVNDHCTSTGACRGHDVAICPTEKLK